MRDLSLHLLDILQNSIAADAVRITIHIVADRNKNELRLVIADNGKGMDEEFLRRVTDPFVTTRKTRPVGMGLSLFKAAALLACGDLRIQSVKGEGTTVTAEFQISHIDRPPLGSIAETFVAVVAANPEVEFELTLINQKETFYCSTREMKAQLGDVPVNHFEVLSWLRSHVDDNMKSLFGGVLDEIDC